MAYIANTDETLRDLSAVERLTVPVGTHVVWVQAQGQNVWMRFLADPDTQTGTLVFAGHPPLVLDAGLAAEARFLEAASGGAIHALYLKSDVEEFFP